MIKMQFSGVLSTTIYLQVPDLQGPEAEVRAVQVISISDLLDGVSAVCINLPVDSPEVQASLPLAIALEVEDGTVFLWSIRETQVRVHVQGCLYARHETNPHYCRGRNSAIAMSCAVETL